MAIDLKSETPVRFSSIPDWCRENLGPPVNRSTAHRWRTRGARGVKLETFLAGGTRFTTEEALLRFFAASTAAADQVPVQPLGQSSAFEASQEYLASQGLR